MSKIKSTYGHEIHGSADAASVAASVAVSAARKVSLLRAALRGADLVGVEAPRVDLRCADLRDAALRGADFSFALLEGADTLGADTRRANFEYADLRFAKVDLELLREARLRGADLRGAQVYRGDQVVATLTGNGELVIPGGPAGDYILLDTTKGWVIAIGGRLVTLDELDDLARSSNSSLDDRRATAVIHAYIAAR